MDRDLLYPGQIGLVENTLDAFKASMVAVAISWEAVLGQSTQVFGFSPTPLSNTAVTGNAFAISVDRGAIFSYQETDVNAYGVLGIDATNILKTGINFNATSIGITNVSPPPAGYSINYLVSAQFQETDTNSVSLPFYNTSGAPTISAENFTRTQRVVFSVTGGTQATTGTQTTPSAPAGSVPLYVVTIANGQTSINAGDISVAPGAPFITTLPSLAAEVDTVSNNLSSEVITRTAQTGNLKNVVGIYSTTTLTASQEGSFVEIAAGSAVTTTLPTSVGQAGAFWRIFNSSSYTQTSRTAAGIFIGPGGNNTASITLLPGQVVEATNDNAAWVLSAIGTPKSRYGASQSGTISIAGSTTYAVASVTFAFPAYSRTGAFRILARMVSAGFTTASGTTRQNFTNILYYGTNSFTGAEWLCVSVADGDNFGFSDTVLTSVTYAPGSTQTFTMKVQTAGGDTAFGIQGCFMELYVEEA
jgi:hypothetical protein